MKKYLITIGTIFCFQVYSLFDFDFKNNLGAYDKNSIDKVKAYISKKWSYYDFNGKKIIVRTLSWKSYGNDYEIIINGKSTDPAVIFGKDGKNILDPRRINNAPMISAKGPEKGLMKGITEAHNKYRRKTGSGLPDLVWDEDMAAYAQEWADLLRQNRNCRMQHRMGSRRIRAYGENLAWAGGKEFDADEVVKLWYEEIKDYSYQDNSCRGICGHYTQVVWKNSKKLGCAMAKCAASEVWVCNYDPPGNYIGQRPY